ncbi:MAG: FHA domain-containing protein [Candidatus Bruticola sp.]
MPLDGLYKLYVVSGADEGETIVLYGSSIKIMGGTCTCLNAEEGCLTIRDRSIGGLQAVLTWDNDNQVYNISNRSAISPIVVNGKACSSAILVDGATIEIGQSVLIVEAPAGYRGPTDANICEIDAASSNDVYLGDSPSQQIKKRTTPAWLKCGDEAPDLPELTMERVTSEDYWSNRPSSDLIKEKSAKERADMYAPASRVGRPPGPLPLVNPEAEAARKLGISLQIYRKAVAEGLDPALYARAYRAGIDPHIYIQAVQDGQDPRLYARAFGLGLDPKVYIEALNKGYDPFTYNQLQATDISLESNSSEKESPDVKNAETGDFAHLFAPPPPPISLNKPIFHESVSTFDTRTLVSSTDELNCEAEAAAEELNLDSVSAAERPVSETEAIEDSSKSKIVSAVEVYGLETAAVVDKCEPAVVSVAAQYVPVSRQESVEREVVSSPEDCEDENGNKPRGRLVVIYGANRGLTLDVYGNVAIGRSGDNDLVLSDLSISRQHCSIQFLEDGIYLVNHSTSSTTKLGRVSVKSRARLDKEGAITLANKVRIHWESYD